MAEVSRRDNEPRQAERNLPIFLVCALAFTALACDFSLFTPASKPSVMILSPLGTSTFSAGEKISIQSVSTDPKGVSRVELVVDNRVVRTDTVTVPQARYSATQTWQATPGAHMIVVRAFNAENSAIDPAGISIVVLPAAPTPSPTATLIPTPTVANDTATPAACKNDAAYVADVTLPDGVVLAPGAMATKTWRIKNTGTCAWGNGYQIVFVSGETMSAPRVQSVPSIAPGASVDLSVALIAPTNPGSHTGGWRMRTPEGIFFGVMVTVKISVPTPAAPTAANTRFRCSGTPEIEAFFSDVKSIPRGGSTTLRWGTVTNADEVEIDQGIGGVAAGPMGGSTIVSPSTTTTYTMTAYCGSTTATLQVTIKVSEP